MNHRLGIALLFICIAIAVSASSPTLGESPAQAYSTARAEEVVTPHAGKAVSTADTFVELSFADADTLDPALAYDTVSFHVIQQIYETLVRLDPADSGRFIPLLAKNWQVSGDGLTYTFDIRQGSRFHDGGLLYAHDVAYTIQRGLLQSDPHSPQWTLITPIMGYESGDITEEIAGGAFAGDPAALRANASPAELLATCNKVMTAVSADDVTGRVTIRLAAPRGDFLAILAQYAPVLDSEWAIAQGAWNGDCGAWQNYYAPGTDGSPLSTITNGTGPFRLQSWQRGAAIDLRRFPLYWQPAPTVPVNIDRAVIQITPTASQQQLLLGGQADLADPFALDVEDHVLFTHDRAAGWQPTLSNPGGSLRAYTGIYSSSSEDVFFVFDINPTSSYIGSGAFDGNGVPPNFFSDVHVRRAFNYAFNFDAYRDFIEGAGGDRAIRRTGPIIKDLPGYAESQPVYTYNLTLALHELQQAWGGQPAAVGFRLRLAYNEGNSSRQAVVENLKAGIEALDPKFHVDVVELPWSEYLSALRSGTLPLFSSGWVHDYVHPHNWVEPYLIGTMAGRQGFPADLLAKYQAKVALCLTRTGNAARVCYEDIQVSAYSDAPGIYLFQRTGREYVRTEVGGFEASGLSFASFGSPAFFALWKSGPPVSGAVVPGHAANIEAASTSGATVRFDFPVGAVNQDTRIVITPDVDASSPPTNDSRRLTAGENKPGRFAFNVEAFGSAGQLVTNLTFLQPTTLTLRYTSLAISPLIEDELLILRWDGTHWVDAACGPYQRNTAINTLTAPICATGLFAVGGIANEVYLPVGLWR